MPVLRSWERMSPPVLQRYWQQVKGTRPYFGVGDNPELDDFRRIAPEHPVFRVIG
jgi:hypothetical protein